MRKIEGQKTLLSRTIHAIAYDEIHDEFLLPVPFPQAILTFSGDASGEQPPVRIIQGPLTQMNSPNRLGIDPVNNEVVVPEGDRILTFRRDANGNVAPLRVLQGPDTQLGGSAVGIDPVNNLLVVAGEYNREGVRFRIYDRTASGNAKPLRVIGGPKSGFMDLSGPFTLYPPKGWIIAGDRGEGGLASNKAYLGVWSVHDNGDVPPRWRVGGPNGIFEMPRGVAVNAKHKEVIVSDKRLNAVLTFSFPELF